jgi:Cu/Ag efflux pump CusA
LDSLFQDAFLKKEQQILADNIKESEEVKKGFYIHLADALETQKIEAEKVLKTQLESQVILLFFLFYFTFCFIFCFL